MEVITKSAQETQSLGQKIGFDLKQGRLLAFYGELGSGKTTFIQGLAKGLGIKKRILSPTFVFVRSYPLSPQGTFYHVDLYRINKVSEATGLGLEEIFADPKAITVIEWAEKIKPILPKKRTDVFFKYLGENQRRIKIK
jgi:tRNA threonylcarbamoyladenosine biosynthesis protein TsaE